MGGDDTLIAGAGVDTFDGGTGIDTVSFINATSSVIAYLNGGGLNGGAAAGDTITNTENLTGSNFTDILHGDGGDNTLIGLAGNDQLDGGGGNDTLDGGLGSDLILGGAGIDTLLGGDGTDTLVGGAGADTLTGGTGADSFSGTIAELTGDTITDLGAGDSIVISDATLAGFTYSISGHTLSFSGGGSLTLSSIPVEHIVVSAASGGGVQLRVAPVPHNDFNGDGLSDILLRNDNGTVTDWLAQSNGSFSSNSANFTLNLTSGWQVAGTDDFNGDGRADIMWRAPDGTVTDWLGQADGTFFNNYASFTINASPNWHIAATGDFNGDGQSDIMWRADDGTVTDWLGQADGTFFNNWASFTINASSNWHIIGTGDFNGDGTTDMLWRADDGTVSDWLGQADGTFFNNYANFTINASSNWHIIETGDFNGDGKDDILWRADDGTVTDWLGQSNGGFASNGANFSINASSSWHVVGTGDFNADGKTDILWQSDAGQFSDWFGQSNGAIAPTAQNFNGSLDTHWHVEPEVSVI